VLVSFELIFKEFFQKVRSFLLASVLVSLDILLSDHLYISGQIAEKVLLSDSLNDSLLDDITISSEQRFIDFLRKV
jgi:hypothetical protein